MTRDGVPSRSPGRSSRRPGPPPLVAPQLTVTSAGGDDTRRAGRAVGAARAARARAQQRRRRDLGARSARGCRTTSRATPCPRCRSRRRPATCATGRASGPRRAAAPPGPRRSRADGAFAAPIDPPGWTLTVAAPVVVPRRAALRRRRSCRRCAPSAPHAGAEVRLAGAGTLRSVTPAAGPAAGRTVVEVAGQPVPDPAGRRRRSRSGCRPSTSCSTPAARSSASPTATRRRGRAARRPPRAVSILCAGQDRIARDPALWARLIAGGDRRRRDRGAWTAFAAAVAAQTASGADPPVLLLDHRGAPLRDGRRRDPSPDRRPRPPSVIAADGGDLQRAVARMHAADPARCRSTSVFGRRRPGRAATDHAGADVAARAARGRCTRDGGLIEVTPALPPRHLHRPASAGSRRSSRPRLTPLADYTRGNRLTPFVNGLEYYDRPLPRAQRRRRRRGRAAACTSSAAGRRSPTPSSTVRRRRRAATSCRRTLLEAAELLGAAGRRARGSCRRSSSSSTPARRSSSPRSSSFSLLVMGLLRRAGRRRAPQRRRRRRHPARAVRRSTRSRCTWIIDTDGRAARAQQGRGRGARRARRTRVSRFAPHPGDRRGQPAEPAAVRLPVRLAAASSIRHFGFYHQKFGVVQAGRRALRLLRRHRHQPQPPRRRPPPRTRPVPRRPRARRGAGGARRRAVLRAALGARRRRRPLAFDPTPPARRPLGRRHDVVAGRAHVLPGRADPLARAAVGAGRATARSPTRCWQAIDAAREFIYIEDQYFTPPEAYRNALGRKVDERRHRRARDRAAVDADQPFGEIGAVAASSPTCTRPTRGRRHRPDRLPAPPLHGPRQRPARRRPAASC